MLLLQRKRRSHRRGDERVAFAEAGEKYCVGVCSAGVLCCWRSFVRGNTRTKVQGAGSPDAVLQAAKENCGSASVLTSGNDSEGVTDGVSEELSLHQGTRVDQRGRPSGHDRDYRLRAA